MALGNLFAMVNISEESEEQSGEEQASSSTTSSSSDYHTVRTSGNSPTDTRSAPTASSSSVYYSIPYSTRIQSMIENRSNFSSESEFDIEYSRDHWSELTGSDTDNAATRLANREHFEVLKQHSEWGGFFLDVKVELGEKINEGGQAEIFDAKVEFEDGRKSPGYGYYVVKVMKGDCPLQDFQRQWPVGMLCNSSKERVKGPLMWIQGGTLVDDRFAFLMLRQWGDLRKLIDMKMQLNRNQGPPFENIGFVKKVMLCIARDMDALHKYDIVHRDLKASNVLLWSFGEGLPDDNPNVKANVVDYECSLGVVGTGFWRAPEVLEQLKKRIPSSEIMFTFMTDVYSYGMTCYELLTGRTPFEGHFPRDYDLVLSGNRPNLSQRDVDVEHRLIVGIIKRCWNPEPLERPTFSEIVKMLEAFNSTAKELQFAVSTLKQHKVDILNRPLGKPFRELDFEGLDFITDELRIFLKSAVPSYATRLRSSGLFFGKWHLGSSMCGKLGIDVGKEGAFASEVERYRLIRIEWELRFFESLLERA